MAYGLSIRLEHHDFLNKLSRIDISERDYVGDYIERELDGPQPLQITWGDQSNPLPCIYGSEAIIRFLAENDLEFLFLFTSDAKKYKVEHTYDGALDWSGFIAPGNWNEPLVAPSYIVEATAIDGLGNLKNEVYPTPEESEVSKTMLQIIATILAQTGLSLNINTCVDWKESEQTTGTDPLAIHKAKTQHLAGQNSYELLEKLIPKCRIMQRLGQWWILSYNALQADTITYRRYNSAGEALTPATATISVKAAGYWIEGEPQLEIIQAIKQQIAVQDYGYNDNLVSNGNFDKFNEESATFDNWTNIGVTPEQRKLDKNGNKFVYLPGKQYPDTLENFGFGLMTYGIRKQIQVQQTTSLFKVAFEYALMGASYSCPMFVRIRIVGDTGTWFLRLYPYTAATDPVFTWKKQTVSMEQGEDRISIASTRKKTNKIFDAIDGVYTNVEGKYYNTYDYVKAWPWNEIQEHFAKFEASTEGLPISGTLEIMLYVPFTNRAQIAGACYHTVTAEILDEEAEKYPVQRSFKVINDTNNTHWPDDETYQIGDFPNLPNANIMYNNGLFRANGTHTTAWQLAGSTSSYTFVEMLARLGVAIEQHPRQQYNIRLQYITPTLGIIIDDLSGQYLRLIENGITYDNRMGAIEGNYIQLPDINIDTFDVEVATEFDEKTGEAAQGSTVTPTTQAPVNSEKSVQIVDSEGVITSQPGYLDSEYFTDTFNEETGYVTFRTNDATGILTELASRTVEVTFIPAFKRVPVGRKHLHIYRVVEPETGILLDQTVLFHTLEVSTTGFTLEIDSTEDLTGIIIEYHFTPQTT